MKKFKFLLLCFLLINIFSAITGIQFLKISPDETTILYYKGISRVIPIINSFVLALFYYGINQKKHLAYLFGILTFSIGYIYYIYKILNIYFTKGSTIISLIMGLLACSCLFFYTIKWWISIKSYFHQGIKGNDSGA